MRARAGKQHTAAASSNTLLTENEAARRLRLSPRTLQGFRVRGGGPSFVKLGRRVLYRAADLDAYVEAQRWRSTSESAS